VTETNARTEHAARIAPPEEFRADSFRRKRIAPGVTLVLGKRGRERATSTQSIRFAEDQFTADQARAWLERQGYRPTAFEAANAGENPDGARREATLRAAPVEQIDRAAHDLVRIASRLQADVYPVSALGRGGYVAAAVALIEAASATARASALEDPFELLDVARSKIDDAINLVPHLMPRRNEPENPENDLAENPADPFWREAGLRELQRKRRHGAIWQTKRGDTILTESREPDFARFKASLSERVKRSGGRIVSWHPYRGNPEAANPTTSPAPEGNPRELVQIGIARQLDLEDGTRFRWTVAEAWPVLVEAGAESAEAGRARVYLVSPGTRGAPGPAGDAGERAARTFETWHGFDARKVYQLDVPEPGEFKACGRAAQIVYRSDKWEGRPVDYVHDFKRSDPPDVLCCGAADSPRALMLRGGQLRVTRRGLVH
jgi:hypothetical protein